jgi:replicative superfamily II helicase
MSKSAFELRFDTLLLARDHLVSEYEAAVQRANFAVDDFEKFERVKAIKYPSLEEIYKRAEELKAFVDGKPFQEVTPTTVIDNTDRRQIIATRYDVQQVINEWASTLPSYKEKDIQRLITMLIQKD